MLIKVFESSHFLNTFLFIIPKRAALASSAAYVSHRPVDTCWTKHMDSPYFISGMPMPSTSRFWATSTFSCSGKPGQTEGWEKIIKNSVNGEMYNNDRWTESRGKRHSVFSDLRSTEAESRQFGVGPLWVNHQQALFLIQTQVPACGDMTNTERLPPLHVATAPAAGRKQKRNINKNLKVTWHKFHIHYVLWRHLRRQSPDSERLQPPQGSSLAAHSPAFIVSHPVAESGKTHRHSYMVTDEQYVLYLKPIFMSSFPHLRFSSPSSGVDMARHSSMCPWKSLRTWPPVRNPEKTITHK